MDAFNTEDSSSAVTRPSSWPVRRERRQIAEAANSRKVGDILSRIETRLTSIELRLGPPGFSSGLEAMFETRFDTIEQKLNKVLEDTLLQSRVNRLEVLLTASPVLGASLDGVLSEVLRRKTPRA